MHLTGDWKQTFALCCHQSKQTCFSQSCRIFLRFSHHFPALENGCVPFLRVWLVHYVIRVCCDWPDGVYELSRVKQISQMRYHKPMMNSIKKTWFWKYEITTSPLGLFDVVLWSLLIAAMMLLTVAPGPITWNVDYDKNKICEIKT